MKLKLVVLLLALLAGTTALTHLQTSIKAPAKTVWAASPKLTGPVVANAKITDLMDKKQQLEAELAALSNKLEIIQVSRKNRR